MMARVPSYYEQYPHSQQSSLSNYNNFTGGFASAEVSFPSNATSNGIGSTCSNGYTQNYPYHRSSSNQSDESNGYPFQYDFSSLVQRNCSQPDTASCRQFFNAGANINHLDNGNHFHKEDPQLSSLLNSSELDAHLNDLPLESLLHLTQPEERLIDNNCLPSECPDQIFNEDQGLSSQMTLHRSVSPSAQSIYSSVSTSPSSCSPQSSPFSPQSTSCSSQPTSFSPQAPSCQPEPQTTSSNSPIQPNHQLMDNSTLPYDAQPMLCFGKGRDDNMNSLFEDMMDECPSTNGKADMLNYNARTTNLAISKRQHKQQKIVKKKSNGNLKSKDFTPNSCQADMRNITKNRFLEPTQETESVLHEGRIPLQGKELAIPSRGGNVFVPPIQNTVEPKKPPPPRKRMKSSALSPEEKICGVCGDVAKNMHFGGMACDSCKAFFRRSVQSATFETFRCEQDSRCVISKTNRRGCQYCRFQKCQSIGMQIEWVMTESDRMTLLKNRLAKTRQVQVEKEKDELYGNLPRNLPTEDAQLLNDLLNTMHSAFASMPYPAECSGDNIDTLSNIFVYLCKRFGKFYFEVNDFNTISSEDKTYLLKNGIAMSLYINGAHMYDPETQSWPAECVHDTVKVPRVTLTTLQALASIPDAFATVMKFYFKYENDLKDEIVALLMYLISFFLPDDPNLVDPENVRKVQEKYINLLKRYLIARDGWQSMSGLFTKLIDGINYIKDILKFHAIVDIKPTINHNELANKNVSYAQPMKNLIMQIQEAFKGNFSQFASILGSSEQKSLPSSTGEADTQIVKRCAASVFGPTIRTDMIISSPFQSTMEWDVAKQDTCQLFLQAPPSCGANDKHNQITPCAYKKRKDTIFEEDNGSNLSLVRSWDHRRTDAAEDVSVETVCDILKQLSHTEDKKVLKILKKNIPVELLQKFSQSLKEN